MNVKQLKEQLVGMPDEAPILVPGGDHLYRLASVDLTTAMVYVPPKGRRLPYIAEDHGDEHNDPGGRRTPALVFSSC